MFIEQEKFWRGKFGDFYIKRNLRKSQVLSNIQFFKNILKGRKSINSILEFGCNVGLNLQALHHINKKYELTGVDINKNAIAKLRKWGKAHTYVSNINLFKSNKKFDLTFTKGVLIHVNPKDLRKVYSKLYNHSKKFVLIAEYYSPKPVKISYHGKKNKLFKRDFAGEMLKIYKNMSLVSYGFNYHSDPTMPQDDINWFLLKK